MHYNEVRLVQVYTREKQGKIIEESFPSDKHLRLSLKQGQEKQYMVGGKIFHSDSSKRCDRSYDRL